MDAPFDPTAFPQSVSAWKGVYPKMDGGVRLEMRAGVRKKIARKAPLLAKSLWKKYGVSIPVYPMVWRKQTGFARRCQPGGYVPEAAGAWERQSAFFHSEGL